MYTEYKISRKSELKNFKGIFPFFSLIIIMPLILHLSDPNEDPLLLITITLIGTLLFFIPQAIIHMRFYSLDRNKIVEVDLFESKIVIKDLDKISTFVFEDIRHVWHYMSPPLSEKRMKWFPWDSYNYSKIVLKNGDTFIITSLLVFNLELPIGDKCETVKTFYAYP